MPGAAWKASGPWWCRRFAGVAVHDAWAPYDTFTRSAPGPALAPAGTAAAGEQSGGPVHQLCTAHVQREAQVVADTAGDGQAALGPRRPAMPGEAPGHGR